MKPYRLLVRPAPDAALTFYDDYADLIGATKAAGMFRRGQVAVQAEIWKDQTLVKRWESYSWKHRDDLPVYRVTSGLNLTDGEHFTGFAEAVEYATSLLSCGSAVNSEIWEFGEQAATPRLIAGYHAYQLPNRPLWIEERIKNHKGGWHTTRLEVVPASSASPRRRSARPAERTVNR
jgi:hypothetical protein